jgi:hypothetical protein
MYGKASTPDSPLLYPDGAASHSAVSDPPLVGVQGDGYYSAVTRGAKDAIDGANSLVCEAIRLLPEADASCPFTLADIACANGGPSIDLVQQAIHGVRARWPRRPLVVIYIDQPHNDCLFQLIHGLTPIPSYHDTVDNVYVLATATSLNCPLVPPGTLDLGFSAAAMHRLSRKPGNLPAHIQAVGASGRDLAALDDMARLRQAARLGGAEAFIDHLPRGSTPTSAYGSWNRTRRSSWMARGSASRWCAIMPRASLLILDEPVSSLDPRREQRFFGQWRRGMQGQPTRPLVVFISHRFSTGRQADTILLLDEGQIRAEGNHAELIRRDTSYAELFAAQARWYRSQPGTDHRTRPTQTLSGHVGSRGVTGPQSIQG